MVNMNKGPLHIRKHFYLILQLLANIVRFPKRSVCIHNYIYLHEIILKVGVSQLHGHRNFTVSIPGRSELKYEVSGKTSLMRTVHTW